MTVTWDLAAAAAKSEAEAEDGGKRQETTKVIFASSSEGTEYAPKTQSQPDFPSTHVRHHTDPDPDFAQPPIDHPLTRTAEKIAVLPFNLFCRRTSLRLQLATDVCHRLSYSQLGPGPLH